MSRREDRDSESRRRRSRFNREPSPKRSRRDRKPEAEKSNPGSGDRAEQKETQRLRLQDALALEPPLGSDNKSDKRTSTSSKEATRKGHGDSEGAKQSSDPSEVPRSRPFSQHDDRNHAGQGAITSSLRATSERGWWKDARVELDGKEAERKLRDDDSRRGEKDDSSGWKHDGFLEMEGNLPRKRPFREQKNHNDKRDVSKKTDVQERARKDDKKRGGDESRPYTRGDRYGGGNKFRGRGESYNNNARQRQQQQQPPHYNNRMARVEKWKHDMYDEANRSPSPKKDEDRLAKIEALLAS